jgi:hypothetical protein
MKTFTFLAGVAVAYVLGSRPGRDRYQEIAEGHLIRGPAKQASTAYRHVLNPAPAA